MRDSIDVSDLVQRVEADIEEAVNENKIDFEPLTTRISKCLTLLQRCEKMSILAQQRTNFGIKVNQLESKGASNDELKKAKDALDEAKSALNEAKKQFYEQEDKNNVKIALMEGYAIVTLLREKIMSEKIDYEIIAAGEDQSGNNVLFKANPTLTEVLNAVSLNDDISLKVSMSRQQFQRLVEYEEKQENIEDKFKNSILKKMKKMQLDDPADQVMWDRLTKAKISLDKLKGANLNYGQVIEAFEQYLIEKNNAKINDVNYIYGLLEKCRNNLAYYRGPDIKGEDGSFQVKGLSVYGSSGGFTVAKLSNVIVPLQEILSIIKRGEIEGIGSYFTAKEDEGERKFKDTLENEIKSRIQKVISDLPLVGKKT